MNIAVIFAGGVGSRMKSDGLPKQFLEVNEKPIIIHTLLHFETHPQIDAIVLVMNADWMTLASQLVSDYGITKVARVVPGGSTGQESIYHGLLAADELVRSRGLNDAIVLLHDGVRPVIDAGLISANIEGVLEHGSAITCVPCKETVVMVDDEGGQVVRSVKRKDTRIAKAPQSFFLSDILPAHESARAAGEFDLVDSCTLMEFFGNVTPSVIEGDFDNIKVTTPEDYYTLKTLLDVHAGKLKEI